MPEEKGDHPKRGAPPVARRYFTSSTLAPCHGHIGVGAPSSPNGPLLPWGEGQAPCSNRADQKALKFPEMPLRVGFPSKRTQPGGRAHVGSTAAARCGGGLAFRHFSPHAARHRRFLVQRAGVCLARSRNLGFSGVIGCVGERVLDYIRFFTEPSKVIFASCCFR